MLDLIHIWPCYDPSDLVKSRSSSNSCSALSFLCAFNYSFQITYTKLLGTGLYLISLWPFLDHCDLVKSRSWSNSCQCFHTFMHTAIAFKLHMPTYWVEGYIYPICTFLCHDPCDPKVFSSLKGCLYMFYLYKGQKGQ